MFFFRRMLSTIDSALTTLQMEMYWNIRATPRGGTVFDMNLAEIRVYWACAYIFTLKNWERRLTTSASFEGAGLWKLASKKIYNFFLRHPDIEKKIVFVQNILNPIFRLKMVQKNLMTSAQGGPREQENGIMRKKHIFLYTAFIRSTACWVLDFIAEGAAIPFN